MPVAHEIDLPNRLVRSRAWGVVTTAEALDGQRRLRSAVEFVPSHSQLFDLSAVTRIVASDDETLQVISNSPFIAGARRAFVIPTWLVAVRDSMLAKIIGEFGSTQRIFETLAEAEVWLFEEGAPERTT